MQVRTILAQPLRADDRDHGLRRNSCAITVTDPEKAAFEERFGVELMNGYGLSEAMTIVTVAPVFGERRWPSVGLPAHDRLVCVVVDDEGRDVPVRVPGEIISEREVEAAVVGAPDPVWDEAVKAYAVLTPGAELTEPDLLVHCRARLAGVKAPTIVEMRSELPKTSMGEIEKKLLRQQWAQSSQT